MASRIFAASGVLLIEPVMNQSRESAAPVDMPAAKVKINIGQESASVIARYTADFDTPIGAV
jgi:hypothetical protein